MISSRIRTTATVLTASLGLALIVGAVAAVPALADGGLRNCVDITGPQSGRVGCYENVWSGDDEYRMTFSMQHYTGAKPGALEPFYVVAPQTATPQGPVATFPHDHVIRGVPQTAGGDYTVQLQGFFVLCTGQGFGSGACEALWTSPGGDPLPFAIRVDGRALTSAEAIEAAAVDGDVALVNLGPDAVIVGSVTGAPR
jgi:hypothetical protein